MNLAHLIRRAARHYPDAPGASDGSRSLRLGTLVANAERFANALDALGVAPGATVGILSGNRTEYVEVDFGIALAARVRVALNARLSIDDFRYTLADAGAAVLVHSAEFAGIAAELERDLGLRTVDLDDGFDRLLASSPASPVERGGDDDSPAWLTYTSGTTGRPKGVVLSHRSLREVGWNLLMELGRPRPGEELILTQALSHGAGYFVLPQLLVGGGVRIQPRFDPEGVFALAREPQVRVLKCVPAMLPDLLAVPGALDLDSIVYGASPVAGPVLDACLERFGPRLVQIYGQSEAPVTITCLHAEDHLGDGQQRASAGRPFSSVAIEIRDPEGHPVPIGELGEVTVWAPQRMTCYHRLPEPTAAVMKDGWISTRDHGRLDERGFVYLVGRSDEIINSGGYNIAPREVELVVLQHPDLDECVVVGLPDPRWGSAVHALVRPRTGRRVDTDAVLDFVKPKLGFRTPKRLVVVDAIPKNAYGKVDRRAVLEILSRPESGGRG